MKPSRETKLQIGSKWNANWSWQPKMLITTYNFPCWHHLRVFQRFSSKKEHASIWLNYQQPVSWINNITFHTKYKFAYHTKHNKFISAQNIQIFAQIHILVPHIRRMCIAQECFYLKLNGLSLHPVFQKRKKNLIGSIVWILLYNL
jgi:hypothetical protein